MKTLLLLLVRFYKYFLSPLLPGACRFLPTCADYAKEAIERHGAVRGGGLAFCRLCKCHPFGAHGHDPVP